jgi:hypothetical protein
LTTGSPGFRDPCDFHPWQRTISLPYRTDQATSARRLRDSGSRGPRSSPTVHGQGGQGGRRRASARRSGQKEFPQSGWPPVVDHWSRIILFRSDDSRDILFKKEQGGQVFELLE